MRTRTYNLAGGLALANALLFCIWHVNPGRLPIWRAIHFGLEVVTWAISVFLFLALRALLRDRLQYRAANLPILVFLVFQIPLNFVTFLMRVVPSTRPPLNSIFDVFILPFALLHVWFGVSLLGVKEELGFLMKVLAADLMAIGLCLAGEFAVRFNAAALMDLSLVSISLIVISQLILGLIFFRAKEAAEFV